VIFADVGGADFHAAYRRFNEINLENFTLPAPVAGIGSVVDGDMIEFSGSLSAPRHRRAGEQTILH
jgi:hypothetical protein